MERRFFAGERLPRNSQSADRAAGVVRVRRCAGEDVLDLCARTAAGRARPSRPSGQEFAVGRAATLQAATGETRQRQPGCCQWVTKCGGERPWLSVQLFGTTRWLSVDRPIVTSPKKQS